MYCDVVIAPHLVQLVAMRTIEISRGAGLLDVAKMHTVRYSTVWCSAVSLVVARPRAVRSNFGQHAVLCRCRANHNRLTRRRRIHRGQSLATRRIIHRLAHRRNAHRCLLRVGHKSVPRISSRAQRATRCRTHPTQSTYAQSAIASAAVFHHPERDTLPQIIVLRAMARGNFISKRCRVMLKQYNLHHLTSASACVS